MVNIAPQDAIVAKIVYLTISERPLVGFIALIIFKSVAKLINP